MAEPLTSASVREQLVRVLRIDLIGPGPDDPEVDEVLPYAPSRWYLTGFLVPTDADLEQRSDPAASEQLDAVAEAGGLDDDPSPEPPAARRVTFPSSLGLSVLVPAGQDELELSVLWGDYTVLPAESEEDPDTPADPANPTGNSHWQRTQHDIPLLVRLPPDTERPARYPVPDSEGLHVVVSSRPVIGMDGPDGTSCLPRGTRAVSIFLVNNRRPEPDPVRDAGFVFQAGLIVRLEAGFVPRPDPRGMASGDPDEKIADLQYRDAFEYAVGHGVSAAATVDPGGRCQEVRTTWLPAADVEKVEPAEIPGVELGMEQLAAADSGEEVRTRVGPPSRRIASRPGCRRSRLPTSSTLSGSPTGRWLPRPAGERPSSAASIPPLPASPGGGRSSSPSS